jgi:hypothetical protein
MSDPQDMVLQRAISTIGQSDPIIKLLQQVSLGRMKPTDAGLRAVTDSWLHTYRTVIEEGGLNRQGLLRIDPRPRIALLLDTGVLDPANETARSLRESFETTLAHAPEE